MTATLGEVLARVAREHAGHLGAGGIPSYWHGDCLAADCDWARYGLGMIADAIDAHARHVAAEQSRAVAEWLRIPEVVEVVGDAIVDNFHGPDDLHSTWWLNKPEVATAALDAVAGLCGGEES